MVSTPRSGVSDVDLFNDDRYTYCWLWFSLVEQDSQLDQDTLAQKLQHCTAIKPQSPACDPKMACKVLVSTADLISGRSALATSPLIRSVVLISWDDLAPSKPSQREAQV